MSSVWREDPDAATSVLSTVDRGVAIVKLNRPDRLNAWTPQMGTLYFDLLERHAVDPEVRAILVTGAGRGFCAGADVGGLEDMSAAGGRGQLADRRPYSLPMSIGKPIVAAINGPCVGIGVQQALCCDVRFAAADAKLAVAFARFGLVAEAGMSWNMTRLVGAGVAMDLMLSGRTVGAEEALRLGLVTHVSPPERLIDDAVAYCRTLAETCSPWSMRMIKQQVYRDMLTDLESAYARSETILDESFTRADFAEAVKAFGEKRAPAFAPLASALGRLEPE
jgi:enoyl-CoA hydratase/carnithine racemase